jgi:hypothetical protein
MKEIRISLISYPTETGLLKDLRIYPSLAMAGK